VRQKGGLPGPPLRSPPSRIHVGHGDTLDGKPEARARRIDPGTFLCVSEVVIVYYCST
jgi:hypothetical protein